MRNHFGGDPRTPIEGPMPEDDQPSAPTDRRDYKARHWQAYKAKRRRVFLTLSPQDYREVATIADAAGRSVAEQIWEESRAYRAQRFLPPREIEDRIRDLIIALRRIGDAVTETARDRGLMAKLLGERRLLEHLRAIEDEVRTFVQRPWREG